MSTTAGSRHRPPARATAAGCPSTRALPVRPRHRATAPGRPTSVVHGRSSAVRLRRSRPGPPRRGSRPLPCTSPTPRGPSVTGRARSVVAARAPGVPAAPCGGRFPRSVHRPEGDARDWQRDASPCRPSPVSSATPISRNDVDETGVPGRLVCAHSVAHPAARRAPPCRLPCSSPWMPPRARLPRGRHPYPRANLIEGEPGCAVCRAARLGNPVPGPAHRPLCRHPGRRCTRVNQDRQSRGPDASTARQALGLSGRSRHRGPVPRLLESRACRSRNSPVSGMMLACCTGWLCPGDPFTQLPGRANGPGI